MSSVPPPGEVFTTQSFEIPGITGTRPLTIYLPPGYDETDTAYPVMYLFDGQNLYTDAGTLAGGWHLHTLLDKRAASGKTVPIVIGIHHGPRREEELCPWPTLPGSAAKGDLQIDWVSGWLRNRVKTRLRVLEGPENTTIGGSSLGGLLALYGLFRHQTIFGGAIVMSPALWVNRGEIFNYIGSIPMKESTMIYLDCGGREGPEDLPYLAQQLTSFMADLLEVKARFPNRQLLWHPDPDGQHNEENWRKRLPQALEFLHDRKS